jgi:amino acid adenylation domain-containing protein
MRSPRSLVELLRARADAAPFRPAYTFLADGETEQARVTYAGADRAARAVGAVLRAAGCAGERALLLFPHGLDFVAAFWGCLYGGAVAVPAYPPRGARGLPRLRAMVDDARPRAVLTTAALLDEARGWFGAEADGLAWIATDALAEDAAEGWTDPGASAGTLAFLQYTSGSTAAPKGVMVSHGNLLHNLRLLQEGWAQGDDAVVVSWLPLFHDMGLIGNVLEAVHLGAPCVMMSPAAFLQRPLRWVQAVSRYGATLSGGPNFAFDLAVRRTTPEQRAGLDLSRWSAAFNGAEPVRRDTLERFYEAFAPCGLRREALQPGYGLAEATLVVSAGRVPGTPPLFRSFDGAALERGRLAPVEDGVAGARPLVGCGRVVGDQTVAIVDPETRRACADGTVGEIWVMGPSVAGGYWDRPDETEDVFHAVIADTGEGPFLRTGDLGFVHGGELFVAGRAKDLVIVHGRNHYPQDLELTAERAHAAVRPGCGAAFTVDADGGERVVLVCELGRDGVRADPAPVAEAIRDAVAEEHDLPVHRVVLLRTGGIPKTTSGKIQRRGCRAALLAGELEVVFDWTDGAVASAASVLASAESTESLSSTASTASTASTGSTGSAGSAASSTSAETAASTASAESAVSAGSESTTFDGSTAPAHPISPGSASPESAPAGSAPELARVRAWLVARIAERTGRAAREIDPRASFASLGIDSVAAVGLSGELEEWLGRTLPPTLLFDHPSIGRLARWLAEGASGRTEPAEARRRAEDEPIAIVGMGCRFPGADGPEAFWRLLMDGTDAVREVPAERWDVDALYDPDAKTPGKMATRWGGFLRGVDRFDAAFFDIAPREAARMDPQQRLLLEVAWEALEDAGIDPDGLAGTRMGVFVGISASDYGQRQFGDLALSDAYAGTGGALSIAANRLSYVLDLRGPSLAVDTACSSSLVALHLAVRSLRAGECETAIVGGANLLLAPEVTVAFSQAGFMSPAGRCHAFDARADGYVRGEGAGAVVLKPLSRALADGDPVYATVLGSAVNQDGRSNGITAPNGDAQEAVLREAYAAAGVDPAAVDYVEAHGTGTPLGDPIEARALGAVVGAGRPAERPCRIGSAKTNVGHLEAAAGIAGVIKTAMALRHRRLPPSLHFASPNPAIPFDALGLAVQREPADWPADAGRGVAGVSSFGFGGTNAHAVLAEAPAPGPADAEPALVDEPRPILLPLSARDPHALRELARRLGALLSSPAHPLSDYAWTAAHRRAHHDHRLAVAAATPAEAAEALEDFAGGSPHPRLAAGRAVPGRIPRVAFIFGGQGPQWWAMGREMLRDEPVFRRAVEEVDALVRAAAGWSVLDALLADEADSRLTETEVAQPAIFALQVGLAALWASWGVRPDAVVGHSVGEVAAAHVSSALALDDAVRVVVHRGRLMQAATGQGTMAAAALPEDEARAAIAPYGERLALAAVNAPASVVLAGETPALEEVLDALEARGVSIRRIGVRYAFHSAQVAPAAAELVRALDGLAPRPSVVPLVSTVEGRAVDGRALDAAYWGRNVRQPVRFADAVEALAEAGCDAFVEIGPHPVLSRSLEETLRPPGGDPLILPSLRRGEDERATMLASLGGLYARGAAVEWPAVLPAGGRVVAFPRYPWQRERHWMEAPGPALRARGGGAHPLLGAHLELAEPAGTHVWETEAGGGTRAALRMNGGPVPAAALLALARAAAAEVAGPGAHAVELREVESLVLDAPRTVHLVLSVDGDSRAAFRLHARPSPADGAPWTLHAAGSVRLVPAPEAGEADAKESTRPTAADVPSREAILAAEPEGRPARLEAHLRARLAAVLRMAPGRVDADRPVTALGLDSLMALEVKNAVERDLGLPLPIRALLAGPTLRTLAADLLSRLEAAAGADDGAGEADDGEDAAEAPATHGQRAMWLLQQLEPDTALFNVFAAVRVSPAADAPALRRALGRLVERHPALRTTIAPHDGRPVQEVRAEIDVPLPETDAHDWDEETLRDRLGDEAHRPFDLDAPPLLRAALYRRGAAEDVLLLVVHHAAVDFWSSVVLLGDLAALYAAEARGDPEDLPAPGRPFTAYARRQARMLEGPEGERLWAYWRERLDGASPRLALPADRRPASRTGAGGVHRFRLGAERAARLRAFAQENSTTPFTVLLAAWQALLHRWTRADDLLMAAPMAGRSGAEWQGTVGCFMNLVILRGDLAGRPGFGDLLERTQETVLEALQHQEMPLSLLAERLPALREGGRTAPVQAMFVFNRPHRLEEAGIAGVMAGEPGTGFVQGAWTMEALPLDERTTPCELCLWATEVGDDLSLRLQYAADLFEPDTAARIAASLGALLDGALDDPARPVAALPLLDFNERTRVLAASSGEAADFPRPLVHHALAARAAAAPAIAVSGPDGMLTCAELDARANRLAHHLRALGVGAESVVGVCLDRSAELVVALYAVLRAGGAYLPLDPTHPEERRESTLRDAGARVLVMRRGPGRGAPAGIATVWLDADRAAIDAQPATDPGAEVDGLQAAYVIYTSGSTGRPKGTVVSHAALANHTGSAAEAYGVGPADRVLQFASAAFDASAEEIYPALARGAPLIVRPEGITGSAADFLAFCGREGITVLDLPTAYWHALAAALRAGEAELPPSVRLVIIGGERALPERVAEWRAAVGEGVRLVNSYGPTEATIVATRHDVGAGDGNGSEVPIGRPIHHVQAYVLDAALQPVPDGMPGELFLGGAGVARGYLGRPGLTAARFIPDPFSEEPGARLYATGDLARRRGDGTLEFAGRLDDQVKVRGYRIEPGEVEAVLLRHPDVRAAAVAAREDAPGERRLVAYVVADVAPAPPARELREFLGELLPGWMVPTAFVLLDALPLTAGGKTDRRALPAPEAEPASADDFVAPRTPAEALLAEIWGAVLGRARVGVHDPFFALGGDSILALQVVARARRAGVELPPRLLLTNPSVARLAAALGDAVPAPSGEPPVLPLDGAAVRRLLAEAESSLTPATGP